MATNTPTFGRLEYFNTETGQWQHGHGSLNLMNPQKYIDALADADKIARLVEPQTDVVIATNEHLWDMSEFDLNDATEGSASVSRDTEPEPADEVEELELLADMDPNKMTIEQAKRALVEEGNFTTADLKSYGHGFAIKALIALRAPAPEPQTVCDLCGDPTDNKDRHGTLMCEDCQALDDLDDEDVEPKSSHEAAVDAIEELLDGTDEADLPGIAAETDMLADMFDDLDDTDDDVPVITTVKAKGQTKGAKPGKMDGSSDLDLPQPEDAVDFMDAPVEERMGRDDAPAYDPTPLFIGMPTTKDYIFEGHYGAGPSGSERWMTCTASLGASRRFLETLTPNQQVEYAKSGTAARQGTTAHAVGESQARLMLGQITEEEHDNTMLDLTISPPDGEEFDEEMAEYIVEYSDLVKRFADDGHEVLIEERVTATVELMTVTNGEYDTHEIKGSVDFAALPLPRKTKKQVRVLTVGDLKYGKGKEVEADENSQAKIYALGLIERLVEMGEDIWDIDRVDIIIVQPRLGGIKTWSTTVDDLLEWRDEVLSPALTEALGGLKGGAKFVPGEIQCQWCPARGTCAALAEARVEEAVDLFDVILESEVEGETFPETGSLTNERLADLYSQISGLTKIAEDLKAEMQRRLHRGLSVPGFQLVNYQPPRHWGDDVDIEATLEEALSEDVVEDVVDLIYARKLLSPPAALKALGKGNEGVAKVLEELIVKPDIRPVVAPEGDRRKTYEGKPPETMFDDLPDEE